MYEIKCVRSGEEGKFLLDGWEPFSVVARDTSYNFKNNTTGNIETHYQSTDYIYLRCIVTANKVPPRQKDNYL